MDELGHKLGAGRIFADSYQFYVYDKAADPFDVVPDWDVDSSARGYIASRRAVYLGTRAHLNDHWIEVYRSDRAPDGGGAERVLAFNLDVRGDAIAIMGPTDAEEDVLEVEISPGPYTLYVLAYNIGADAFSTGELEQSDEDEDMTDEELEGRHDFERYRLVLVPGTAERTGVLRGTPELPLGTNEP